VWERQRECWAASETLAASSGHVSYDKLNQLVDDAGCDLFVEDICELADEAGC